MAGCEVRACAGRRSRGGGSPATSGDFWPAGRNWGGPSLWLPEAATFSRPRALEECAHTGREGDALGGGVEEEEGSLLTFR